MSSIYIFMGPGGVGKTTCAASLGVALAQKGKKVVVFTVDPAKRLAQALGLKELQSEAKKIHGIEGAGELWALWLDPKSAFEGLVKRLSPREETQKKILEHRLFKIIQEQLGGIEEYLGVEKLFSLKNQKHFDVFILDTPPSQHSLDFLESPHHLLRFLDDRVIRFFLSPEISKKEKNLFQRLLSGTKEQAFEVFRSFLGQGFLKELATLLENLKPVREELIQTATELDRWLQSEEAKFFLVSSPETHPLNEVKFLKGELQLRFPNSQPFLVLNRFVEKLSDLEKLPEQSFFDATLLRLKNRMTMHQAFLNLEEIKEFPHEPIRLRRQSIFAESHLHNLASLGQEFLDQWEKRTQKNTSST